MHHVGLTGNAAAGKSAVSALFENWGATVIDADRIVRELQQPGEPVFDAIVDRFGRGVVRADGSLDRDRLRMTVMADPVAREALNAIVHPAVQTRRAEGLAAARMRGDTIVVDDIPLLFEILDPTAFDTIVLVDAPTPIRRARLLDRGLAPEDADRLMASQLTAETKRARSDFVIDNGGSREELAVRARAVWDAIVGRAERGSGGAKPA